MIELCELAVLKNGEAAMVEAEGLKLSVVRLDDDVFVVGDTCSHANFSLSEGEVDPYDKTIECWKHGATFSLDDGKPGCLPATKPIPVYDVQIKDGSVYIADPDIADPDPSFTDSKPSDPKHCQCESTATTSREVSP